MYGVTQKSCQGFFALSLNVIQGTNSYLPNQYFKGDSFLTLSLLRGLPLMSKIVWR